MKILESRYYLLVELYYKFRRLLYFGKSCYCPCCNSHLRKFLYANIGSQGRVSDIRCPRCDSHPRHRLLWLFLQEKCGGLFAESLRLLHIAPEFCFQRRFRTMKNLRYVTGDLVSPLANSRFDLTAIPIANDAIDVVVCNHVLEHVADDSLAIRELFRVMKPGGWGILQVPVDPDRQTTYENRSITTTEDRTRHFGQSDHVRLYGVDYPVRLGAAGFEVTVVDYRKGFAEDQIKCFGLNQVEAIYLCVKPYRACA